MRVFDSQEECRLITELETNVIVLL